MSALKERHNSLRENLSFLGLWLKRPSSVGAMIPSSRKLAAAMAQEIDKTQEGIVVELGGGTGKITRAILDSGVPPQHLLVVEREPSLARLIGKKFPGVQVVCGDACELDKLLERAGAGPVKAVVSGLPLLSLPDHVCWKILSQVFSILSDTGVFVQFTYGPKSSIPQAVAGALAIQGERSCWILDNLPPAAVWRYRRAPAMELRRSA